MRDPDTFAERLREAAIDPSRRRLLVSVLANSDQEPDLSEAVVCEGLGRIRHFRQATSTRWPDNPLPIAPAAQKLGLPRPPQMMPALVYQNAVCNWRCWYCFVPFNLLAGHRDHSRWVTAEHLVALFQQLPANHRPAIIDLSGGQPDLVPEWTVWMLDALNDAGLATQVYLWSDDNLSNDYLFRYLRDEEISRLSNTANYGRVCCLKGFDHDSFAFNTGAPAKHFDRQFDLLRRLVRTGMDIYCYVTLTTPTPPVAPLDVMRRFVDRLQDIDEYLPWRVVPLQITVFGPVGPRMRTPHEEALGVQDQMVDAWNTVLAERSHGPAYTSIVDVPLGDKPQGR
ncbi:putative Fe-S cluster-containing radical SAM superfamily protein [Actinomadura pelletieri DSM 43383]|uniref:Putative Fe-S cluster-containing radical SAM superfamily protein n=1 Tax=Actinomadura pelletieri DSM 43383 TaxID=1120940 RepID=A0A495QXK5_9ACTN|nr:radical SAM protein [Actinomadura pelletieri]RKS78646.1 putative Fe-S cluster-containing radical SAM superfamily protein [Actinomadura pelletieri DSM 43383]